MPCKKLRTAQSAVVQMVMALAFALAPSLTTAQAQTFTVLHAFSGFQAGSSPEAGPTLDRAGNLYGTTAGGGANSAGTVYEITP